MKCIIKNCARCGKDHEMLEMQPFTNPFDDFIYFAICPELNEPILIKIENQKPTERPELPEPSELG